MSGVVSTLISNRVAKLSDANKYAQTDLSQDELIWVDSVDGDNRWNVLKASTAYNFDEDIYNPNNSPSFGDSIATNDGNTFIGVGSPDDNEGKCIFIKENKTEAQYTVHCNITKH